MTIKHYTDATEQGRAVAAFISSTESGPSLESYADTNQDTGVNLEEASAAGGDTDINGTADVSKLGNDGGTVYWLAQSFQIGEGRLSTIKVLFGASTGSPSGDCTWEIQSDSSGDPDGTALASGSITPTASTEVTVNIDDGARLQGSTTYWLVLKPPSLTSGNYYTVQRSGSSVYANGQLEYSTNSGSSWTALSSYDLNVQIITAAITEKTALAQSFQLSGADAPGAVKLYLKKAGSPTGNLTVKIETDSGGDPSGTPVTRRSR
jgi:hypothetical protein